MGDIFMDLLNTSITASWLIIAVLLLRLPLKKTPKWISCLLWGMVALRLICPISLESPFSMVPTAETIKSSAVVDGEIQTFIPSIDSNLDVVENTINPMLQESFSYEPSESVSPLQVVTSVAGIVWLCGMGMMLLYMVISRFRMHRLVRESVRYRKNIYLCDGISSPFILGVMKPRIYLSSSLKESEMQYIIAHERAHLMRKDHWWKPLGFLLLSIYWFNPLCWVAYSLLCRDIEMACDEKVIRDMSFSEKKEYSRVLVSCGQQRRMVMACPLAFGEVGVKERVKTVLNYKKPAFWISLVAVAVCAVVAICFLTNPEEAYQIRITIPAGSTAEFCFSDEEISPKGDILVLSNGDGLGDCSVVLKPVRVEEENAYEPTYMTPGMPVKMDVEKGAWFKIGVSMQNDTAEDKHVYVTVKNVEVRIAESDSFAESGESGLNEANYDDAPDRDTTVQRYGMGDLDGNGVEEFMEVSEEGRKEDYDAYMSFYFNGDKIYEYDALLIVSPGNAEYIDLDKDGENEIFFTLWPQVNSMPLIEYVVLKRVGNEWKPLEMIHGETMLDNAFPITVQYGKEKNTMVMSCEGTQEQIVYDFTAYYEAKIQQYKEEGLPTVGDEQILKGAGYEAGDSFGGVASWGVWTIKSTKYDGVNCLIASHGILGPQGNQDLIGELDIYFNYNEDGLVDILNMEFRENSDVVKKADNSESGETQEDYYEVATTLSTASEIEEFALDIKEDVLSKDWISLSEKIKYPITINGITVNDSTAFQELDIDERISQEFVDAIAAESCREMFCNWQGIMMGATGQIWFTNLDDGSETWELKIFGINGMLDESEEIATPAATNIDAAMIDVSEIARIVMTNGNTGEQKTLTGEDVNSEGNNFYNDLIKLYGQLDFSVQAVENERVGYQYSMVLYDADGNKLQRVTPYKDGLTVEGAFYQYDGIGEGAKASLNLMEYMEYIFDSED